VKITDTEEVVAAWAEEASGPGYSNALYWVLLRETAPGHKFGRLRIEALQPEDQPVILFALHATAAAMQRLVRGYASAAMRELRSKK